MPMKSCGFCVTPSARWTHCRVTAFMVLCKKKKRIDERMTGIRDKSFELAGADGVYNLQQNKHTISKTTMSPREIQNGIIVKMTFGMDSNQGFTPLWCIRGDH